LYKINNRQGIEEREKRKGMNVQHRMKNKRNSDVAMQGAFHAPSLIPMFQRRNPYGMHSHAGAWKREIFINWQSKATSLFDVRCSMFDVGRSSFNMFDIRYSAM